MFQSLRIVPSFLALFGASILAAEAPADLETAQVEYVTVEQEEVFDGVIEAVNQSTISAQTSGRVTGILFDVEDHVAKDSIIVQLRDTEQQARLAKAESGLEEAQARYTQAQEDHQRKQNLFKEKAVSKAVMESAVAAFKAARAGLDAARAQVAEAREQLEHTVIRSPYSGIVVERYIETGETVQPGMPLMTGLSLESLRVSTQIPEHLIGTVRTYHTARVMVSHRPASAIQVHEVTVSPRADAVTHSFEVRIPLPEGQNGLYPGMSVKVAITTGEVQRLLIPSHAIVHRSEVSGIYVVSDKLVVFRQIRLGRHYGDSKQEVLAGLSAGEQVALDPVKAVIELKRRHTGRSDE